MNFKERCKKECTRDAIFLFQRKVINWHHIPDGWQYSDDILYMIKEDAEFATEDEIELFRDFSQPQVSLKEMAERITDYDNWEYVTEHWETESVFLTREEGENYGNAKHYNYPNGWRVYCVCAEGKLAELIKNT